MSSQSVLSHLMRTHCYGEVARTIVVHGKCWLIRIRDDWIAKRPEAGIARLFKPVQAVWSMRFDALRQLIRCLFQTGQYTAHWLVKLKVVHFRLTLNTARRRGPLCGSSTTHCQKLDWDMVLLWIIIVFEGVTAIVNLTLPNIAQLLEKIQGLGIESTRQ